jgi:hypothetical protein
MIGGYSLSELLSALKQPSKFVYELEHLLSKYLFTRRFGHGIDVIAEDWDNLVILDACRTDYFSTHNELDGELQSVVSQGANSREFIDANFKNRKLHDTVYVTANPFVELLSDDVFFKVYYSELFEQWDDTLQTIPPKAVVEATVRMHEEYPNKRIIAHFMQPHAPYIGPTGRELYERYEFGVFNTEIGDREEFDLPEVNIPQAVNQGPIQEDELRQAYSENVQIAADHAKQLVGRLGGKSIITADHGEMLGERVLVSKKYGHDRAYAPELRVVPWLVVDADERRAVTESEPVGFDRLDEGLRESRLSALGYVQ